LTDGQFTVTLLDDDELADTPDGALGMVVAEIEEERELSTLLL